MRKYAAELGTSDAEALAVGMAHKSKEFSARGAEVYTAL
jgi:hypothetical protein